MKKMTAKWISMALVLMLALGLCGIAAAETTPTPAPVPSAAPTIIPAEVAGTVSGVVVHVEDNDIVINMANGNTIMFMMNHMHTTDARLGDTVSIEYSGNIADAPEAVNILVTKAAQDNLSVSGELLMHDENRIFVQISSQNVFGFTVTKDTTVTGVTTSLNDGDTVTVTYSGALDSIPHALNIDITKAAQKQAASADKKDNPTNKHLDGYVTYLTDRKLTLHTNSGHSYSFHLRGTTDYTGVYALETGAKVRVTYDGYAGKGPDAKIVKVIAPPDPNPPSPAYHTTSGTVDALYGVFLTLTNGEGFNLAGASIGGNSSGMPGDKAKITYYVGEDGVYYATNVVFTAQIYYAPGPVIDDEPPIGSGVVVG